MDIVDEKDAVLLSNLVHLDLSNNELQSVCYKFWGNITYLNLSNNGLTELHNLQSLTKIVTLSISRNDFPYGNEFPETLLSLYSHPFLQTFDFNYNMYMDCKCTTIEPLRKWLIEDKVVYLSNYVNSYDPYYHNEGCSYCCSLDMTGSDFSFVSVTQVLVDCEQLFWLYALLGTVSTVIVCIATFFTVFYVRHIVLERVIISVQQ